MGKLHSFCLIAVLGLTSQSLRADIVTVGSANASDCIPFGCAGSNLITEYQQVYSASSFGLLPFNIAAISFFKTLDSTHPFLTSGNYTISFSTTSMAVGALDPTLALNVGFDNQVFFSGALGGAIGTELTIGGNGATPVFNYNPLAGNLLLDITVSGAGPDTSISFDAEDPSSVMSRAANGLADPVDVGLVTEFSTIPPPPPPPPTVPEPGTLLLLGTAAPGVLGGARKKWLRRTPPQERNSLNL
jgi:PEP-CTERM motif